MSSSIRLLFATAIAIFIAIEATGCNDTGTVNRTIPPIAGVTVGGPTQAGGTGNVAMEVNEASAGGLVAGSHIVVENLSRAGAPVTQVPNGTIDVVPIVGDVGDELKISLNITEVGNVSKTYTVPPPTIGSVGEAGVVTIGASTLIQGAGFCHESTGNHVFFDGVSVEVLAGSHPEEVHFTVPLTTTTAGTHSVQVVVGQDTPGDPNHTSSIVTVSAVHH